MERKKGLSKSEALSRLRIYGKNVFSNEKVFPLRILLKQFASPLIYLLIIAAVISLVLSSKIDALIISLILFINAIFSFIQEYRSEKSIEKLHNFIKKTAMVRRDSQIITIPQEEVVPGDVVIVREGDIVPADGVANLVVRVLVDEAVMSGESFGIDKSVGSKFLAGTTVVQGYAELTINRTGHNTELGKIAFLTMKASKISEYEKEISDMTKFLVPTTFVILIAFFLVSLSIKGINSANIISLLLFTVALAISIVPEALPVIATLTMSTGALKLAKRKVVVKRLSSVEDLGNIQVLCTDKTGTITKNSLEAKDVVADNLERFYLYIYISSEEGNPFDSSISGKIPDKVKNEAKNVEILDKFPFDPARRRRWTLIKENGKEYLVVLGSGEVIAALSNVNTNSGTYLKIKELEKSGLRVLGIGTKEVSKSFSFNKEFNDSSLDFQGFYSVYDPIRETAGQAIDLARKLNVQVKILTGDSLEVANYIAKNVGLINNSSQSFVGADLERMTSYEFAKTVSEGVVFASLTPEKKCRIIDILKQKYIVGYQGDGINDAPALKAANVGIAVQNATDLAQNASDIILLEKNLSVIIEGIEEGRKIFKNIDKYIKHTMASNWGIFFAIVFASFFINLLPLLPIQVLLTNLLSDFPLLAVSTDNVDHNELTIPAKYNISDLIKLPLILGIVTAIFNLAFFVLILNNPIDVMRTIWFVFITVTSLVVIFSVRKKDFMWKGVVPSKPLFASCLFVVIITLIFPLVSIFNVFHFVKISLASEVFIILATLAYLLILDIVKVMYYQIAK